MDSNKQAYFWNIFSKKGYIELQRDFGVSFQMTESILQELKPFFETDFLHLNEIDSFTIAKESKRLIDELIDVYKLDIDYITLYALSAIIQKDYIDYHDDRVNTASGQWDDIEFFHIELNKLFHLIEIQLKNQTLHDFDNITVKFKEELEFKSVFIFKEMFESLIHFYDINLENFEEIKSKKLAGISNVRLEKLPEFRKLKYSQGLYRIVTFKQSTNKITNTHLKFIACFLLLSQIPINSEAAELIIPKDHKDVKASDVNNLRTYLKGDKKLFHNIEMKKG